MLNDLFVTINQWMSGGLLTAAIGCLLWGMISVLLSPCHMASIPLIVGYVGGQDKILEVKGAAKYAVAFTVGLFITIAALGVVCAVLGRMLGDVSPYWTILVGAILLWVALDMLGVQACSMSSGAMSRLRVKGIGGAFILGLAYGILSGSCTFGFIAPILAVITVQEKIATGVMMIILFGVGHCIPIAAAGSSAALVRRVLSNNAFLRGGAWFRKGAGVLAAGLAVYFIVRPFIQNPPV
ncbi:cytochrome c biogenesis CcdA family protein [Desulfatibacillum aliphaticivorans]|uniref:Cytochrome c biogenesis protein transmembrane region n=1 Tax=Desulfatibacillum aliphaticivorans TaxID=218208 RepID=B8FCX7_DESAL|nr:cytochrome c biogenesis protein CcdA [Desulfatibacillum aliphaticivorans]ACL06408.1 cytochrome c biogenesis protein transmembrane region [Desulfatibacillum aliphaticivorans]